MTNFEANREMIEKIILETGKMPLSVQKSGEIEECTLLNCTGCLFGAEDCVNKRKVWLNSEAESEEMRFAKTLKEGDIVEVTVNGIYWCLRYFKQISECQEHPFVCYVEDNHNIVWSWKHIRKAEFRKGEQT